MVVFGTNWFYSIKVDVLGQRRLYSEKSGFIRARMVVFGQKLFYCGKYFYLGKSCCIRAKVVLLEQKLLYSGKLAVFGQSGCNLARLLYLGKRGCIR